MRDMRISLSTVWQLPHFGAHQLALDRNAGVLRSGSGRQRRDRLRQRGCDNA